MSKDDAMAYILVAQALAYIIVIAFGLPGLYQFPPGEEVKTCESSAAKREDHTRAGTIAGSSGLRPPAAVW